jgi:hypothetical protein
LRLVRCWNFHFVTVTSHLCRSVGLIHCVTVTGLCRIDRNGTVYQNLEVHQKYVQQHFVLMHAEGWIIQTWICWKG